MDREAQSVLVVLAVTLAALVAGWTVRDAAIDPMRRVVSDGIAVELPADWLMAPGAADVAIVAHDPNPPLQRIRVGRIAASSADSLEEVAAEWSAAQARQLDGYRLTAEGAETIAGRPAHGVAYAFLETDAGGLPTVVRGQAYYLREGDAIVVVAVEADETVFPEALRHFDRAMASVELVEVAK